MVLPNELVKRQTYVKRTPGQGLIELGAYNGIGLLSRKYTFKNKSNGTSSSLSAAELGDVFVEDAVQTTLRKRKEEKQRLQQMQQDADADYARRLAEATRNSEAAAERDERERNSPAYKAALDAQQAQRGLGRRRRRSTSKRSTKKKSHTRRRYRK